MEQNYDKTSVNYDRLIKPLERWFLERWRAETLGLLPSGGDILELGAGTGLNFSHYPPSRCAVSTEISAGMLDVSRAKASLNLLVQADAQRLPFDANAFDAAFAALVFCTIPDPILAFAEARRVLRPGGKLILLEHVRPPGLLGRVFDMLNLATSALMDDNFNRRTAETAASSGFHIIEIRRKAAGIVNLIICEVAK